MTVMLFTFPANLEWISCSVHELWPFEVFTNAKYYTLKKVSVWPWKVTYQNSIGTCIITINGSINGVIFINFDFMSILLSLGEKGFIKKKHFFETISFECICGLDLCSYDNIFSDLIIISYALLHGIILVFSIYFKVCVQAIMYGEYIKTWIYWYLVSWPWPLSKPKKIWLCI